MLRSPHGWKDGELRLGGDQIPLESGLGLLGMDETESLGDWMYGTGL